MHRLVAVLPVAALLVGAPLHAQSAPTAAPAPAATAPAAAKPVTPGALRAAKELLELTNLQQVVRASTEATFDAQVKAQPQMAPFRPTMQAWVDQYITWAELEPRMTRIYAEELSEDELRQLIAFYKTPIGKKLATLSPALSRRGAEVGAELAQAHMGELQVMIQARAVELQQGGQRP